MESQRELFLEPVSSDHWWNCSASQLDSHRSCLFWPYAHWTVHTIMLQSHHVGVIVNTTPSYMLLVSTSKSQLRVEKSDFSKSTEYIQDDGY